MPQLNFSISTRLNDLLEWFLDQQPARPSKSEVARQALRRFLGKKQKAPEWEPRCPRCEKEAWWIPGLELTAVCYDCHHWETGPHEGETGHTRFAKRWGRP